MKIIRVTEEQFHSIWDKLTPMQRTSINIAERNIAFYSFDAIVVVSREDGIKILDLPESAKSLTSIRYFSQNGSLDGFVGITEPPKIPLSKYYEGLAEAARKQEAENAASKEKVSR